MKAQTEVHALLISRTKRIDTRYRLMDITTRFSVALLFSLAITAIRPIPHAKAEYGPVTRIAPERFTVESNGRSLDAPYVAYRPPDSVTSTTRLVCLQHGAARNPFSYLARMVDAIELAGAEAETMAVVFQWLEEKDIDAHRGDDIKDVHRLLYYSSDWRAGNKSRSTNANPRPFRISNFEVLDRFLIDCVKRYPNLREITITGHSAGGQMVNRYAIGTQVERLLVGPNRPAIQFVAFNPSSYLYLDDRRWNVSAQRFEVPSPEKLREAPEYNRFKYGLEGFNGYFEAIGVERIHREYPKRQVTYVVGEDDKDPMHPDLDRSPSAMLQGSDRLSRGVAYFRHLTELYGPEIKKKQRFVILPGVGHSSRDCLRSSAGLNILFGKGVRDDGPIAKYGISNGE